MIKLGILGSSEGNGHPYSWSAIFNGYNENEMKKCSFPVIYDYLSKQNFPEDAIKDAKVTHIWTQDINLSNSIAKASKIKTVLKNYEDMLGKVDAILLARDDAQNHYKFAELFIKAGLPIYIDKPIALSIEDANKIYDLEQYKGQIFTCSALRYAKELQLTSDELNYIGEIKEIVAQTPKSWEKYAIHILEPLYKFLEQKYIKNIKVEKNKDTINIKFKYDDKIDLSFTSLGNVSEPIKIVYIGKKNKVEKVFYDSFSAFKEALENFILSVHTKKRVINKCTTMDIVNIIEKGIK